MIVCVYGADTVTMTAERSSQAWRRALSWIGVLIACALFAGIAVCEGYLAQQPPHYLRLVWLVPIAALWALLVLVALLLCLGCLPRPRLVKPLFVATAVLSPLLAWPFTQLTTPLADYQEERAHERWRAAVEETNRRHLAELTDLFARPQRVTALYGDALLLESGVAVELHLAQPGIDGVFEAYPSA